MELQAIVCTSATLQGEAGEGNRKRCDSTEQRLTTEQMSH